MRVRVYAVCLKRQNLCDSQLRHTENGFATLKQSRWKIMTNKTTKRTNWKLFFFSLLIAFEIYSILIAVSMNWFELVAIYCFFLSLCLSISSVIVHAKISVMQSSLSTLTSNSSNKVCRLHTMCQLQNCMLMDMLLSRSLSFYLMNWFPNSYVSRE